MYFYQDSIFAGCWYFFDRPGLGGLGLVLDAAECVACADALESDWTADGMLRHAHKVTGGSPDATRTPEPLESSQTRQSLACQKSTYFGYLDKNTSLYRNIFKL